MTFHLGALMGLGPDTVEVLETTTAEGKSCRQTLGNVSIIWLE